MLLPHKLPSLALGLECVVEVEGRPPIVIHSSLRLIRHIKRMVQHSRGLVFAVSHVILGWEHLAIKVCFATIKASSLALAFMRPSSISNHFQCLTFWSLRALQGVLRIRGE